MSRVSMGEITTVSPEEFVALPRETQLRMALQAAAQVVVGQTPISRLADMPRHSDAQLQFGEDQTPFRHGPSKTDDKS